MAGILTQPPLQRPFIIVTFVHMSGFPDRVVHRDNLKSSDVDFAILSAIILGVSPPQASVMTFPPKNSVGKAVRPLSWHSCVSSGTACRYGTYVLMKLPFLFFLFVKSAFLALSRSTPSLWKCGRPVESHWNRKLDPDRTTCSWSILRSSAPVKERFARLPQKPPAIPQWRSTASSSS